MRVIVVNDYGHAYGGAAQVAVCSLNSLADTGLEVVFVSGVGPVDPAIDTRKVRCVNFGLPDLLENPSRFQAAVRGVWDSRCADGLSRVLADCEPANTVVHLHSWVKCLSPSVVEAALSRNFPTVCTLHDYFSVCPNGGFYNFPREQACPLRPMSLSCVASNCDSRNYGHKLWRVGRWLVQDRLGGLPSKLRNYIAVSSYSERLLRPYLPSASTCFHVRNPIQIDRIEPSPVDRNSSFIFAGRLSSEKGPDLFAKAAKLADVSAVFAGSGPKADEVAAMYPGAQFLGWQNREGVIRAIGQSRALVFPSLWHETEGMVVSEAAALGVASIVSDSCAASEAIHNGKTGLLFRSGDPADLAAKLETLDRDPHLAAELGSNAYRAYWSKPSTLEMHTQRLLGCYEEILRTHGKA